MIDANFGAWSDKRRLYPGLIAEVLRAPAVRAVHPKAAGRDRGRYAVRRSPFVSEGETP